MKRRSVSAILLFCVLASWGSPSRADASDPAVRRVQEAESLYKRATESFEREDFGAAYEEHRRAWELYPSFKTAVGLGQVELHLQKYRDAAEHLSFALRHLPPDAPAELRERLEYGIAEASEHVGTLHVTVNVDGATVAVDGTARGRTPLKSPLFVEPGTHRVEATLDGYAPAVVTVTAAEKGEEELSLVLAPKATPQQRKTEEPDFAPAVLGLVTGGALTVGAVTMAILFNAKGSSAEEDMARLRGEIQGGPGACLGPSVPSGCDALARASDDRNTSNRVATISTVAAVTFAAVTAGVTYLLWPSTAEPERDTAAAGRLKLDVGLDSIFVSGRF